MVLSISPQRAASVPDLAISNLVHENCWARQDSKSRGNSGSFSAGMGVPSGCLLKILVTFDPSSKTQNLPKSR